jgi:hypothetical protein
MGGCPGKHGVTPSAINKKAADGSVCGLERFNQKLEKAGKTAGSLFPVATAEAVALATVPVALVFVAETATAATFVAAATAAALVATTTAAATFVAAAATATTCAAAAFVATATTTCAATSGTRGEGTLFTRTSFHDFQRAPSQLNVVQAIDGSTSFFIIGHFHERKSTRAPRLTIEDDPGVGDKTVALKRFAQLIIGHVI